MPKPMLTLLSRHKPGSNIEIPGIERGSAMYFIKARCSGHAQQFLEEQGANALARVFRCDIQLAELSRRKVQGPKAHRHRSDLGYDDVSFGNVSLVARAVPAL
jgi:hypothetical protein